MLESSYSFSRSALLASVFNTPRSSFSASFGELHARGNYILCSFMLRHDVCVDAAELKNLPSSPNTDMRFSSLVHHLVNALSACMYVSLRYSELWFHKMEHWHQTIKRFVMREILSFRFSFFLYSLMQQMLLNESTILGILSLCFRPSSRPIPPLLHAIIRFERVLQFLSSLSAQVCAECAYWMLSDARTLFWDEIQCRCWDAQCDRERRR